MAADNWEQLTLGEIFVTQAANLNKLLAEVREAQLRLNAILADINNRIGLANATLSATLTVLEALDEAGFYVLRLAPNQGNLVSRIQLANNPPNFALDYSCGLVIGASAPNIIKLIPMWHNLLKVLSQPL
jgi:hypothetical protein